MVKNKRRQVQKCNAENTTVLARSDGDSPVPIPRTPQSEEWVGGKEGRAHKERRRNPVPLPASALSEEWVGGKERSAAP